jgi:hypothetical protein
VSNKGRLAHVKGICQPTNGPCCYNPAHYYMDCNPISNLTGFHQLVPASTNWQRLSPTLTNWHQLSPTGTTRHQISLTPTGTTQHQLSPMGTTQHQLLPTSTTQHRPAPSWHPHALYSSLPYNSCYLSWLWLYQAFPGTSCNIRSKESMFGQELCLTSKQVIPWSLL